MSRIGKLPITVPAGVEVKISDTNEITVKGKNGTLSRQLHPDMIVKLNDGVITVERPSEDKMHKSLHGLTRTLVNNMVIGVTEGFTKELEINGVGYRAAMQGKTLNLSLGYSHPVLYEAKEGVTIEVPAPNKIIVKGANKEDVGATAAKIREYRQPEPYKGKGIKKIDTKAARVRRHARVRKNISGTAERPRLNVFRSAKHIYAQVIDDVKGVTLVSASSMDKEFEGYGGNVEGAKAIGQKVAEKALAAGIKAVVFDRGGYVYHGRVAALAEGAREGGLEF